MKTSLLFLFFLLLASLRIQAQTPADTFTVDLDTVLIPDLGSLSSLDSQVVLPLSSTIPPATNIGQKDKLGKKYVEKMVDAVIGAMGKDVNVWGIWDPDHGSSHVNPPDNPLFPGITGSGQRIDTVKLKERNAELLVRIQPKLACYGINNQRATLAAYLATESKNVRKYLTEQNLLSNRTQELVAIYNYRTGMLNKLTCGQ